jgi:hypothetical protein
MLSLRLSVFDGGQVDSSGVLRGEIPIGCPQSRSGVLATERLRDEVIRSPSLADRQCRPIRCDRPLHVM